MTKGNVWYAEEENNGEGKGGKMGKIVAVETLETKALDEVLVDLKT